MTTITQPTALQQTLAGRLITPEDVDYDEARSVWNGSIDRHPRLIARCTGTADVVEAVNHARTTGIDLAVRGGGHNVAGLAVCDDGIVADLSPMKGVHVDPFRRVARVQPGATWAELDRECQVHGLAVTGGLMSSTGVAGFTLGGGIGWLQRRFGLACDNLRAAHVVTADGRVVTASPDHHPDLLWALRGGGGNFGVVTAFEFDLHPVGPTVFGGMRLYPMSATEDVIAAVRERMATADESLMLAVVVRKAPHSPKLPNSVRGAPVAIVAGMHCGAVQDGRAAMEALDGLGAPLVDAMGPKPYTAIQKMTDASWAPGFRNYWKADYLTSLDSAAAATLKAFGEEISSPISDFKVAAMGGAVGDEPEGGAAFAHRDAPWVLNINTRWEDPSADDRHVAWTRELFEAMQPHSHGGTYVNFLGAEGPDRVRRAYDERRFARLREIKATWDPTNLFHHNQNIPPAASSPGPRPARG